MRLLLASLIAVTLFAADETAAVRKILEEQAAAWNRGDLEEFVRTYENSPAITFVGKDVERGYAQVLARYQRNYGTPEKRGKLVFEQIEVRLLGKDHALVLGRFVLTRTAAGGGDASGRFTLVARKQGGTWKIIHDHTSS
jgi:uncharacterized protein (TIGR02246 family)